MCKTVNGKSGKPPERKGKVLFINADREFIEGRAQNYLGPEHVEKIVSTYETFAEVPGFSALVDVATLRENDFNLNIRRYADNAPPPEPHDVRAHLFGGVPKAEVDAKKSAFRAHGLDTSRLLVERDAKYMDFKRDLTSRQDLKETIERDAKLQAKEQALREAFDAWWAAHGVKIVQLASQNGFVGLRNELLDSFNAALESFTLLDRFEVRGIVAGFWEQSKYDFKTLMSRGSKGVVDAWRTSILTALKDENSKDDPLDHKLVKFLLADYVARLGELEAKKAELEAQIKSAAPRTEENEEEEESDEEPVDEAQLAVWKKELASTRKELKVSEAGFEKALNAAVDALDEAQAAKLLLSILHDDMRALLERHISRHRQQVVAAFENWWDKYRVTLTEIEQERDAAAKQLQEYLKGLGYV